MRGETENISHTHSLTQTSMFQSMILAKCKNITSLPDDAIGDMQSLSWLDLRNCKGLTRLPDSIGKLSRLRQLDLSGCKNLKHLPGSLAKLKDHLEFLNLSNCISLEEVPPALACIQPVIVGWPTDATKSGST